MRSLSSFPQRFFFIPVLMLTVVLSACATAVTPPTPTPSTVFTVGIVSGTQTTSVARLNDAFKPALEALGYTEGQNLKFIDEGILTQSDKLNTAINTLIADKVNVMVVLGTTAVQAAKTLTATSGTPVVFAPGGDPVDLGLVKDLTAPGGNLTGLKTGFFYPSEAIQYMLQINPNAKNFLVIYDPKGQGNKFIPSLQDTGTKLNVNIVLKTVSTDADVTAAFNAIPANTDAVLNIPDNLVNARVKDLVAITLQQKIPLITVDETTLEAGALLSYSWDPKAMGAQVAQIVDQILKGTKPGVIPIQAGEFYVGVNLKTAQAIGITVPDTVIKEAATVFRS